MNQSVINKYKMFGKNKIIAVYLRFSAQLLYWPNINEITKFAILYIVK